MAEWNKKWNKNNLRLEFLLFFPLHQTSKPLNIWFCCCWEEETTRNIHVEYKWEFLEHGNLTKKLYPFLLQLEELEKLKGNFCKNFVRPPASSQSLMKINFFCCFVLILHEFTFSFITLRSRLIFFIHDFCLSSLLLLMFRCSFYIIISSSKQTQKNQKFPSFTISLHFFFCSFLCIPFIALLILKDEQTARSPGEGKGRISEFSADKKPKKKCRHQQ